MKYTMFTLLLTGCARAAVPPGPPELQQLYRVAIPDQLPDHPRVFVTPADLARIEADYQAGDAYTVQAVNRAVDVARGLVSRPFAQPPNASTVGEAERLAIGYILSHDRTMGEACRDRLLALAKLYPTLQTTPARGRLTSRTLEEGPVALRAAMAYDLCAAGDLLTPAERKTIEQDFLRIMGWETGHRCGHANSSNWRTWAMAIVASCGFAAGDRDLIEEAINGVWDPDRNLYLYGVVQQIQHSIFADGIHWERSIGYTYYTAGALMPILEAAKNSGIDLWHAPIPSLLKPFPGSAPHEEYGPEGIRSMRAFLDAPFYYAFPGGALARIGDTGSTQLAYHPIYELAWQEYGDPKYAWLIHRERAKDETGLAGWNVWRAAGEPAGELRDGAGRNGSKGYWMRTGAKDRLALVQEARCGAAAATVTGWVKVLAMDGGSAHLRVNYGDETIYSDRVRAKGDWQQVTVQVPAAANGQPRSLRIHVFLEGGAGEVVWDDLAVAPDNTAFNGDLEAGPVDGRSADFWDLVNGAKDVPAGEYDLTKDATIGLNGTHVDGQTLFPVGGFAILRADAANVDAPAVLLEYGPYGSGHDHPDRLHISVFGLGQVLCPDAGSWGYENPMHVTWANQTMAHNTLTVDEVAQWPQLTSDKVWVGESGDRRAFGVLRLFHAGKLFQAVRATCDTVYDGVMMDRSLALRPYGLIDVFRATAEQEHTYDLALHGEGKFSELEGNPAESRIPQPAKLTGSPFHGLGYNHLQNLRGLEPQTTFRATFTTGDKHVQVRGATLLPGRVYFADDPAKGNHATACILARQQGRSGTWVSVIAPYRDTVPVNDLAVRALDGGLLVTVTHAGGTDRLVFPDALDGSIKLTGDAGEETAAAE